MDMVERKDKEIACVKPRVGKSSFVDFIPRAPPLHTSNHIYEIKVVTKTPCQLNEEFKIIIIKNALFLRYSDKPHYLW